MWASRAADCATGGPMPAKGVVSDRILKMFDVLSRSGGANIAPGAAPGCCAVETLAGEACMAANLRRSSCACSGSRPASNELREESEETNSLSTKLPATLGSMRCLLFMAVVIACAIAERYVSRPVTNELREESEETNPLSTKLPATLGSMRCLLFLAVVIACAIAERYEA